MRIRRAEREDLGACARLDPSFVTERVWQLDESARGVEIALSLRQVRLPRPLRAEYPRAMDDLDADWERRECLLVAEDEATGEALGFIDLVVPYDAATGWVKHLVVAEGARRRGIGSQLLAAARAWCEYHGLERIMAECQTKNYPAVQLYQKSGLEFCGFNDMYYSRDVALFFAARLMG